MDLNLAWGLFKETMTVATGVVATGFSLYFAWQKIGISIKASYSVQGEQLSDIRLNDIIISNYKNKPIEIYSIYATINNKYFLEVESFDSPLILKPLETIKVKTSPLSIWNCNYKNKDIKVGELLFGGKIILYISTNTSIIKCNTLKKENALFSKKFKNLKLISKYTAKYNNIVYTKDVKYVIDFIDNNKQKSIFIFKNGFMSDSLFGFNALPQKILQNKENIKNYFKSKGLDISIHEKDNDFGFK